MAITTITSTKNGSGAIDYVLKEKEVDVDRVLSVRGYNLDPQRATEQMSAVWRNFDKADGETIQAYRLIQSFREEDLNKNNADDIEKANEIGYELAKRLYPDRQALVVTHGDGEGGKLHNHIIVNSVSAIDGKSLRGDSTSWSKTISKANDTLLKEYEIEPLLDKRNTLRDTAYKREELSILHSDTKTSWKDTIRQAIDDSLTDTNITTISALQEKLKEEHEIDLILRGKTISYKGTFNISTNEEEPMLVERKARGTRLGKDYTFEVLKNEFKEREISARIEKFQQREPIKPITIEPIVNDDEPHRKTRRRNNNDIEQSEQPSYDSEQPKRRLEEHTVNLENTLKQIRNRRLANEEREREREEEQKREREISEIRQNNRTATRKQNSKKRQRDNSLER